MSITIDELERLHVDLQYKFDVYINLYKRYLDQSLIDERGYLCMRDMVCKDLADSAKTAFEEAYSNFRTKYQEYSEEQSNGNK